MERLGDERPSQKSLLTALQVAPTLEAAQELFYSNEVVNTN